MKTQFLILGRVKAEPLPLFLEFIHATFKQIQEMNAAQNTVFVVIFMGAAVTLVSTEKFEHSSEPKLPSALEIKIKAMAEDGTENLSASRQGIWYRHERDRAWAAYSCQRMDFPDSLSSP